MKSYKFLCLAVIITAGAILTKIVFAEAPIINTQPNYSLPMNFQQQVSLADKNNSNAILLAKINDLQNEIQQLRGHVEVQAHDIRLLNQQQRSFYTNVDERIIAMDRNLNSINTQNSIGVAIIENKSEDQLYTEAYQLIQDRKFDNAIIAMNDFLIKFPNGSYVDNANYWLGELYFAKNDMDMAIESFNLVINNYPNSGKVAPSILKLGFAYQNQGKIDLATNNLKKLQQNYPNTSAANFANLRLQELSASS